MDGNVLNLDRGGGYTTVYICPNLWIAHLKWVNSILCELCFVKAVQKKFMVPIFLLILVLCDVAGERKVAVVGIT